MFHLSNCLWLASLGLKSVYPLLKALILFLSTIKGLSKLLEIFNELWILWTVVFEEFMHDSVPLLGVRSLH